MSTTRRLLALLLLAPALLAAGACSSAPRPGALPSAATDVGAPSTGQLRAAAYAGDRRPATFPEGWPFPAGLAGPVGAHAMVVSDAPLASAAGVEVLRRGGNAVDAAVAVGFALAVVYPEAGNLGGGGYMVIRMADGRVAALDYREIAPLAATRDMYLDAQGNLTDKSIVGPLASGVPGAVAGLVAAHAKFGTLALAEVMKPALAYAEHGFIVDSALARSIAGSARLIERYAGGTVFVPQGEPLRAGARLRQPELARTLHRIAERGAEGFYRGETAQLIAAELRRLGGIITEADLAGYRPEWREPVRSTYRGYTLLTMPPSSSGGVTITETLNILEGFDSLPRFGSAAQAHLLASAYQRAFIDRNAKLGDPAFVNVPVAELTDKRYAARLRVTIDPARATPTTSLPGGSPAMGEGPVPSHGAARAARAPLREGMETTHYSVVDAQGNAVATTTTINALYGSGVYVTGAGFFLNDEMDDFAAQPGKPNMFGLVQGEANAIQPRKRMLSAMSPTIVLGRDGGLFLVLGARGGPRIITGTSQVILDVLEHHMTLADAMSAPRLHHQALPDTLRLEHAEHAPALADSLRAMGYGVTRAGGVGLVNAIMRVPGGWEGVADPRSVGWAAGY